MFFLNNICDKDCKRLRPFSFYEKSSVYVFPFLKHAPRAIARGVQVIESVFLGIAVAASLIVRATAGDADTVELAVAALVIVSAFGNVAFDGIVAVHNIFTLLSYGRTPFYNTNYPCICNFYTVSVDKKCAVG